MACGCATRKTKASGPSGTDVTHVVQRTNVEYVQSQDKAASLPHPVLPGESCIFCASKHASMAYTTISTSGGLPVVIGELELARRHTIIEFPTIAKKIADLEFAVCTRDLASLPPRLATLTELIAATADSNDPTQKPEDGVQMQLEPFNQQILNPFIGEVHLCAAYRLAFEVGYMLNNRKMIVGDLALAAEHLVRFNTPATNMMRDIRHRVETKRVTDLDQSWVAVCGSISQLIDRSLEKYRQDYAEGLRTYLGLNSK